MITTVIPVYNEVESLELLHEELSAVALANDYELEILFVDDGSTDGSWQEIEKLAARDERIRGIRFRGNFGKAAALNAGFEQARGEIVFTLDADLQDNPKEIPRFLEALGDDCDVVSGWKKIRHDPWHKVGPSRVFNWLVGRLTGVKLHDHNCGFKCYRREIFNEVHLYGELHRFIPVLAAAKGWKVGEIVVEHRARQFGKSKYGVKRFIKGFLDLLTVYFLTGYSRRPQHLFGSFGLIAFGIGGCGLVFLTVWRLLSHQLESLAKIHLHQMAVFYYCITALLVGGQFLVAGFLAELHTAQWSRQTPIYSIKESIGMNDSRMDELQPNAPEAAAVSGGSDE